jgi:hypothetical protein
MSPGTPAEKPQILVEYYPKPVPGRQFDYSAIRDGYEPGCPIGYGATWGEAVIDLLQQEKE